MKELSQNLTDLAAQLLPGEQVRDGKRTGAPGDDDAPLRARLVESWQGQVLSYSYFIQTVHLHGCTWLVGAIREVDRQPC